MGIKVKPGWLYFLGEENFETGKGSEYVKIGKTDGDRPVAARMSDHQTGNPRRIIEVAPPIRTEFIDALETHLHHRFAEVRVHGEWFNLTPSQLRLAVSEANRVNAEMSAIKTKAKRAATHRDKVSDGVMKRAGVKAKRLYSEYIANEKVRIVHKLEQAAIEWELRRLAANSAGIDGIATQSMPAPSILFDAKRLESERSALFNRFTLNKEKVKGSFSIEGKPKPATFASELHMVVKGKKERFGGVTTISSDVKRRSASAKKWHAEWLRLHSELADLNWNSERLEVELKSLCGVAEGIEGVCNWKRERSTAAAFDRKAFKKAHPRIYESYTKTGNPSVRFKIEDKRPYRR